MNESRARSAWSHHAGADLLRMPYGAGVRHATAFGHRLVDEHRRCPPTTLALRGAQPGVSQSATAAGRVTL
eukprot:COSAG02_NODE_24660_length_681_cov_0.910653_1_plen_70_part_10